MTTLPTQTQQLGRWRYFLCTLMDHERRPLRWVEVKESTYTFFLEMANVNYGDGPLGMKRWEVTR